MTLEWLISFFFWHLYIIVVLKHIPTEVQKILLAQSKWSEAFHVAYKIMWFEALYILFSYAHISRYMSIFCVCIYIAFNEFQYLSVILISVLLIIYPRPEVSNN